jgi:hypothetical protein
VIGNTIADVILRYLQGNGLTLVKISDTTYGSDADDMCHAVNIAVHAERALACEDNSDKPANAEPDEDAHGDFLRDEGKGWRPGDRVEVRE